jgi:hypothetical protein
MKRIFADLNGFSAALRPSALIRQIRVAIIPTRGVAERNKRVHSPCTERDLYRTRSKIRILKSSNPQKNHPSKASPSPSPARERGFFYLKNAIFRREKIDVKI